MGGPSRREGVDAGLGGRETEAGRGRRRMRRGEMGRVTGRVWGGRAGLAREFRLGDGLRLGGAVDSFYLAFRPRGSPYAQPETRTAGGSDEGLGL